MFLNNKCDVYSIHYYYVKKVAIGPCTITKQPSLPPYGCTRAPRGVWHKRTAENRHSTAGPTISLTLALKQTTRATQISVSVTNTLLFTNCVFSV